MRSWGSQGSLRIRLGTGEDVEAAVLLTQACGKDLREKGINQWDEHYPDRASLVKDAETETLFVYMHNERILGIVVLNETQDDEYAEIHWLTDDTSKNLVVHRLAVHPEYQGRGIARSLMDFAENYAKANAFDSIRLDTFSQNKRNQRFYQNRGYQKLGEVYLPYKKEYPYFCYELLL